MTTKALARSVAGGLAVAAAVGLALGWRRHRPGSPADQPGPHSEWPCACGQRFRVTGTGRHRVYWPADAPADEPVIGARCPFCDRPLPSDRELADEVSDPGLTPG
jgi:hypothetical protein